MGSHVALDVVPHYDFESVNLQLMLGIVMFAIVAAANGMDLSILLGALFAALPDFENLLWRKGVITHERKLFPGHARIVPHGRETGPENILLQVAFSILVVIYLVRRSS
jgi:hypothetical protein